jgi:membrane protein YdbS with pleckstrin-like domain
MTTPDDRAATAPDNPGDPAPPADRDQRGFIGVAPVPPRWADTDTEPPPPPPATRPPGQRTGVHDDSEPSEADATSVDTLSDAPSQLISHYLYPSERFRGEWRRHPVHLVGAVVTVVTATGALGVFAVLKAAADPYLAPYVAPWLVTAIGVVLWLAVLFRAGWQVALWHHDRFVLTDKRIMVVDGIITRKVAMMPLGRVTDMKYEQSILGRALNYGTFVLESAGQDQALREVQHLPRPNDLYLRVVEEMYAS